MIEIIKADITHLQVDAIVNAANSSLLGGGGVDGAIHMAAGPALLDACRKLDGCPEGEVKVTPGFDLPAKMVLHTVGPQWQGGEAGESSILTRCYENCLKRGLSEGARTIAFPAISTGIYGYPKRQAAVIALSTMQPYKDSYEKIFVCCFSDADVWIYQKVMASLKLE